jgi:glycerate kinase
MALRILIVPDKFKGTLTAHQAAAAMAAGWRKARPGDTLELLPMSDGGDGFGAVLGELTGARQQSTKTIDAAHRKLRGAWWLDERGGIAIIDSAAIIGLAMLPAGKFHPFQLDSFGLGEILRAAEQSGAKRCIIGIGGSATNDGGFGLARALGWKFFNKDWDELTEWWQLNNLAHLRPPDQPLAIKITVAVDVGNPLLGPKGCSRIYGPQKGLRPQDFPMAERCLARLAAVLKNKLELGDAKKPGAGAAGGLGFGLTAFAGAEMESGFEIFARLANLDQRISKSDFVLTGEGCIDRQTYMGKGVGQVALRCAKWEVPCLAIAGTVAPAGKGTKIFAHARGLTEIVPLERAKNEAQPLLKRLASKLARTVKLE